MSWLGDLESMRKFSYVIFGLGNIFILMFCLYILYIAHLFCVCLAMIG